MEESPAVKTLQNVPMYGMAEEGKLMQYGDFEKEICYSGNEHQYGPVEQVEEVSQGMSTCLQESRKKTVGPVRNNLRCTHACRMVHYFLITCFLLNTFGLAFLYLQPFVIAVTGNDVKNRLEGVTFEEDTYSSYDQGENIRNIPSFESGESLRRLMAFRSKRDDAELAVNTRNDASLTIPNSLISPFVNYSNGGAVAEWKRLENGFSAFDIVFPLNEPSLCDKEPFLFIMVASAIGNGEKRQTIRETWGTTAASHSDQVAATQETRLVFLVGKSPGDSSPGIQPNIKQESVEYHDIIQTNIVDSYANLSFKSIAMLKWMTRYCKSAKFLLKSDDDMFINVDRLRQELSQTVHSRFIMGEIIAGAQPMQDKDSKWYTPKEMYPKKMYPKYVSGSAYVISGDFMKDLYLSTLNTKVFWLEDVFITGLCAKNANAVHIYNSKFGYKRRRLSPCLFHNIVTCHRLTKNEMYRIWKALNDPQTKCPQS